MAWPTTTIVTTDMDAGTDSPANARAQIKQMAENVNDMMNSRAALNGVASLNASGYVPLNQLASGTATSGYALISQGPSSIPGWQAIASFDTGTRLAFQQTSAPTGWTKDTAAAINDSILRLVTGTVSSGGSVGWSTATVGATTLSSAEIPGHVHQENYVNSSKVVTAAQTVGSGSTTVTSIGGTGYGTSGLTGSALNTVSTGGGGSHTHGIAGNCKYYDFIIASKN